MPTDASSTAISADEPAELTTPKRKSVAEMSSDRRPARIMIVDDVPINIKVVQAHLTAAGYRDFVAVTDATQAVATIHRDHPDLLLLDLMMPDVSGLDILEEISAEAACGRLPVLVLTGSDSRDLRQQALRLGAFDFLAKPVDAEELVVRVGNSLRLKNHHDELERAVRERTLQLEQSREEVIRCLAKAAEYRDNETGRHVVRVASFATTIAQELRLDEETIHLLSQAAMLHDVGKIGIPDGILLKNGKLTPEEFEVIQRHCNMGKGICECMSNNEFDTFTSHPSLGASILSECTSKVMEMASRIALTHHEWWDGTGYPLGLAGDDIPLEGRITAVADVFDALSSKRPYKPAFPLAKCFDILEAGRGTQFEPRVLDAFFVRSDEIVSTQIAHADIE
jgi:putative two-component system response regulator